ncbi:hypothetical protein [Micromonospora carbonacea]|uniref:Uncharacterized protein n=1 Tax=Micromonospora carbonacea TaxID=47853 RepID=A0A1C5AB67_9ACTN|nr:hypothetical protein [Micromonospora carbonacea]SCF42264.1 hypothetical protein GA0070563_11258 [Micromonospora carbonacea]
MKVTATRTTDTHGHPLHQGDWVHYRGSYTPAYGQLAQVVGINYDLTMNLTVAGGAAKLRNVRRASVAHAANNGR